MTRIQQTQSDTLSLSAAQSAESGENNATSRGEVNAWPTNPFVGLRPFEASEGLLFFGRRDQTMELLERLHKTRFLSVVGSSGCGKSSLIRAGLIPKLKAGFLVEERDRWVIATMKPGDAPLKNLAASMLEATADGRSVASAGELVEAIRLSGAQAVTEQIAPSVKETDTNVLLLVDQFEEIFRFGLHTDNQEQRDEAADFVSILLALARQRALPIYVVVTMRSDFLGDCDNFYNLPEAMNRSQYLVPRLTRKQRQEAIEGPVRLFGSSISPRLLDRLLNDVGEEADQLPVMQHALMRTWENWQQSKEGPIDLAHYEAVGTIKEALSNDADKALEGMTAEELWITERMFQALTDADARGRRIRRPARLSEIQAITGASRETILAIIERFQSGGRSFLNLSGDTSGGDSMIDISHESLIRQWKKLRDWVDQEAKSRTIYLRIVDAALRHKVKEAKLWGDPDLQIALDWRKKVKPNKAWAKRYDAEFDAAIAFLKRSQLFKRVKLASIFALLLFGCIAFLFDTYRRHRIEIQSVLSSHEAEIEEARKDANIAQQASLKEQQLRQALQDRIAQTGSFMAGDPGIYNIPFKVVGFVQIRRLANEEIELTQDWIKENIVPVEIAELGNRGRIHFHKDGVEQLKAVFKEIEEKRLTDKILSVDYSFIPPGDQAIRSLKHTDGLSPHSLGIAIDINKSYNPPGKAPVQPSKRGSVIELKPIFEAHGFGWGGTVDPSHFQLKSLDKLEQ